jgi:predicted nucleotidyltransferase
MLSPESAKAKPAAVLPDIRKDYGVKRIDVFGAYAGGEAAEAGDNDILVEFERPIGLAFVDPAARLEELLGMRADLVSAGAVKPGLRPYVEKDLVHVGA